MANSDHSWQKILGKEDPLMNGIRVKVIVQHRR